MPFTIHPDQKPSESEEEFAQRIARQTTERAKIAEVDCKLHTQNVRLARALNWEIK